MTRWEYRLQEYAPLRRNELREMLAKAGADGWELVAVTENESGDLTVFLKRPIETRNSD